MFRKLSFLQLLFFAIALSCSATVPPFRENEFDLSFLEAKIGKEPKTSNYSIKVRNQDERTLIPSHYKIEIQPFFDPNEDEKVRFTVPGTVVIRVNCAKSTAKILLDSKYMDFDKNRTKVISSNGENFGILKQDVDEENESFTISLSQELQANKEYDIHLFYTAKVFTNRLDGLYLSNYTDPISNMTKHLVLTHFEPNSARLLFPSFDQPDLKATFDVSVGRRSKYNSLSNMDLIKSEKINSTQDWYMDHYRTSVKMSTYLVAVVVSEYSSESANVTLFNGKPVKIWAAKHFIERKGGVFAAKSAATILSYYEKHFEIEYPLPKMDSIAIPHFSAGAMENFGLNTYREKLLLYFEGQTTESQRYSICSVIGHELGHQLFGNLVTCQTWSHLWLNEGFASYTQYLGSEAACPEFDPWKLFNVNTYQVGMKSDQDLKITHPIVNDTDPSAKFSKITYSKGGSIIRMMESFLSKETFRAGLHNYLATKSFGNARQEDLFRILNDQGLKDKSLSNFTTLQNIMNTWTLKSGYPLVRVRTFGEAGLYVSQESYIHTKPQQTKNTTSELEEEKLWWIPIKVLTPKSSPEESKKPVDFWIPDNSRSIVKLGIDASSWVVVNPDSIGFYRVRYDETLMQRLYRQLDNDHTVFSSATRAKLIDDYFNFANSDNRYNRIEDALQLTKYLYKETEYDVWRTVFSSFSKTFQLMSSTSGFQYVKEFLLPRIRSALNAIGIEQTKGERGISVMNRVQLLEWAIRFGDKNAESYAYGLLQRWKNAPLERDVNEIIPVDIQPSVLCGAVQHESQTETGPVWEFLVRQYERETQASKRYTYLSALTCTRNNQNIKMLLNSISQPGKLIKKSDGILGLYLLVANPISRSAVFDLIETEFHKLSKLYNVTSEEFVSSVLTKFGPFIHSNEEYEKVHKFITNCGLVLRHRLDTKSAIFDMISENQKWMERYYEPMVTWFKINSDN